ncbi:Ger(x)C family spore germination protein [Paenibacillus sp. LHD-38]|uniref:Ger(x)C family spore germination protein n=1 Tax=Paenibacillus sp. LHD-38 TaxID=3072143 RepID=UPI0028107A7D|nr:Ger(x)C family spore germination protein [Paenibacillus sp. LHD-38]MDQ8733425.1 Ger(x)C family spore germination protein [Paenibacillus sp. LHD-38]
MNKWRLLLPLLVCLLTTGCWNRVELNDIAVISASGFDWKDGNWVISYQVVIPQAISSQSAAGNSAAVNVFSTKGESFRSAVSKASQETSRRLYFSHTQIIIIGQEAARKGLGPLLDTYLRNHDSRETVSVYMAKGTARRMLEQLIPLEKIPGAAIQRMITNEEMNSSTFRQMTIHQVLLDLLGTTHATSIPGLVVSGANENIDRAEQLTHTSTPSKVRLFDLALIAGDKLVGWINNEESQGVMWLTNHVKRTTIAFACSEDGEEKSSSVRIIHAKTKLSPEPSSGKWIMHVNAHADGTLMEYNCEGDLAKPKQIETVERLIEGEITSIMEQGWKAVRKHRTDVIGFGSAIHQKYPKQWSKVNDSWPELFPNTEVKVSVKVRLNSAGMSGSGFKKEQKKSSS